MKIILPKNLPVNVHKFMQRVGYHFFVDPNTGKESYTMRTGRHFYPRFHAYTEDKGDRTVIDVHLDQKQASYEGQRAHSGEYGGPQVEDEGGRLQRWIDYYAGGGE